MKSQNMLNNMLSEMDEQEYLRLGYKFWVPDSLLLNVYQNLQCTYPEICEEPEKAFIELANVKYDKNDEFQLDKAEPHGLVQRRAPLNPLRSPLMGKFRAKPKTNQITKIRDPALYKTPLRGRLVVLIFTSAVIVFIFLQTLCYNKFKYKRFFNPDSYGPEQEVLVEFGGLNTTLIRLGQTYRLFWAWWLHLDVLHIGFNLFCQIQYFFMLEPDWGTCRMAALFFVSALTGSFISAVCDPCKTGVGSSGALFGLIGAMLPYSLEYWESIPRPWILFIFSFVVMILSIVMGYYQKLDNWAHAGGMIGGFFFGLMTLTKMPDIHTIFRGKSKPKPVPFKTLKNHTALQAQRIVIGPEGQSRKRVVKRNFLVRFFKKHCFSDCSCDLKVWIIRISAGLLLGLIWFISIVFLYILYTYKPIGQVLFSGVRWCCCCHDPYKGAPSIKTWTCNYCDQLTTYNREWETACNEYNEGTDAKGKFIRLLEQGAIHDQNDQTPRQLYGLQNHNDVLYDKKKILEYLDSHATNQILPKNLIGEVEKFFELYPQLMLNYTHVQELIENLAKIEHVVYFNSKVPLDDNEKEFVSSPHIIN